jgi:hypothetical protein
MRNQVVPSAAAFHRASADQSAELIEASDFLRRGAA